MESKTAGYLEFETTDAYVFHSCEQILYEKELHTNKKRKEESNITPIIANN